MERFLAFSQEVEPAFFEVPDDFAALDCHSYTLTGIVPVGLCQRVSVSSVVDRPQSSPARHLQASPCILPGFTFRHNPPTAPYNQSLSLCLRVPSFPPIG